MDLGFMLPYSPTHSFLSCTHDEELERREREKEYDVCGFLSRWMKGKIRTGSSLHPTHIPFARKLTHRPARKGIIRPGEWTVRSGPVISFHSLRSLIHSFPSTRSHPSPLHSHSFPLSSPLHSLSHLTSFVNTRHPYLSYPCPDDQREC